MLDSKSRQTQIEEYAGDGNLNELRKLFHDGYTQPEIDTALENAIAYSKIEVARYLISIGADLSNYDFQGTYYAVHNNELPGLKFAIDNGVDINVNNGMLINEAVMTAINENSIEIIKWLLVNGANAKLLTPESLQTANRYGNAELRELLEGST